jgi:DNA invertase Pin-like site-specific DNA recombinase
MPTAYAYLRYSTKAQGGAEKDSIDRQMSSISALTKQYQIELLPENIYRDDGVSSFIGQNEKSGKLKDLIDLILSQQIKAGDFVFVESIDRLSRQKFRLSKELVYKILERGVILVTTIDNRKYSLNAVDDNNDFSQDLYLTLIATRAHEESKTKSVRRKSAWNRAKANAEKESKIFNGHNPPYGIEYDKENDKFVINEEEAKEIRFIFENLQYLGVSLTIKAVNEFSKRQWKPKAVAIMLENKYPIGYYKAQKRDENKNKVFDRFIDNYYPQIITFEEYQNAINAIQNRKARKHYGNQARSSANMFRFSLFCAHCEAPMYFETNKNQKGMKFSYFHCSRRKETKIGCNAKRLRYEHVLGLFLKYIKNSFAIKNLASLTTLDESDKLYELVKNNEEIQEFSKNNMVQVNKLFDLINSKKKKIKNTEITRIYNELLKHKHTLENLTKSTEEMDGIIPKSVMQNMINEEQIIDELSIKLNTAQGNLKQVSEVYIETLDELVASIKTEDGRKQLNSFFTTNDLKFSVKYIEEMKRHSMVIKHSKEIVGISVEQFKLRNPLLKEYNFTKITDYTE